MIDFAPRFATLDEFTLAITETATRTSTFEVADLQSRRAILLAQRDATYAQQTAAIQEVDDFLTQCNVLGIKTRAVDAIIEIAPLEVK